MGPTGTKACSLHAPFWYVAVAITGVVIAFTGWHWLDPAACLVLSALILWTTWGLLREALNLALDAVPEHINFEEVERYLRSVAGVVEVHDLHIWPHGTTETILTAHLVVEDVSQSVLLREVPETLASRFRIGHATLQLEPRQNSAQCRVHCAG